MGKIWIFWEVKGLVSFSHHSISELLSCECLGCACTASSMTSTSIRSQSFAISRSMVCASNRLRISATICAWKSGSNTAQWSIKYLVQVSGAYDELSKQYRSAKRIIGCEGVIAILPIFIKLPGKRYRTHRLPPVSCQYCLHPHRI